MRARNGCPVARWLAALVIASALVADDNAGLAAQGRRSPIRVAAASSLTNALTEIARAYESNSGEAVALSFGASGVLARQISEGASVDLFFSADEAQTRVVEAAGRLEPNTRVSLLSNQLVVVVPAERPRSFQSPQDLLDPAIRRIAIGDPATTPAGVYARRYLELVGLWTELQPRIIPMTTVRAALAAAESGDVDAAFVYRSDAATTQRATVAMTIPRDRTPGIVYQAALVKGSNRLEAARRFLTYLKGADARAVFEREGFIVIVRIEREPPTR